MVILENWFRIVKNTIFNSETKIRDAEFAPPASKVFKHKKRLGVENEERQEVVEK